LWTLSPDSADVEVSESEAGWRILVGKEFQRNGAAELKERLPVSSLTGDRRRVMGGAIEFKLDTSLFARYEGLLCWRAGYVREIILQTILCSILSQWSD